MKSAHRALHCCAFAIALGASATGSAAEYGGETTADSDDELAALAAAGELDADGLDALQSLHDAPPDATTASVEELALLPGVSRAEARARVRLRTRAASVAVPMLRFDAEALQHSGEKTQGAMRLRIAPAPQLAVAGLLLVRERTRIDATGGRLLTDGPRREVGLERWYAAAHLGPLRLIVGSFNCAFAESLTFSSARRIYAPSLASADEVVRAADARSIRAVPALRGVALQLELGGLEATAFGSYRALDLYQYGEWRNDGSSPTVLQRRTGEPVRYATIAGAAREAVAGANIDVRSGEQSAGVTAYVARARLLDPAGSWSPLSIYPELPVFGAAGGHVVAELGVMRTRAEITGTTAGGIGAVARVDLALGEYCDLSLAARQYGAAFDNPFARSAAAPDLWEGTRARNERGVEMSTAMALAGLLRLAASVDVWSSLTAPSVVNGRARGRTTWSPTRRESLVLEGECVDKDLRNAGTYEGQSCAGGEDDCARGARATATVRLVTERMWRTRLAVALRHARQDVANGTARESRVTGHVTVRPWGGLSVAIVASARLSARAVEIDGSARLVAVTAAMVRSWGSVDVMLRKETRWDGTHEANRDLNGGVLSLTIQI